MTTIKDFSINIPEEKLVDLKRDSNSQDGLTKRLRQIGHKVYHCPT